MAKALHGQGWTPVILRYAGISAFENSKRKAFSKETVVIELTSSAETELQSSLKSFSEKHGSFGGFIHLHPTEKSSTETKLEDGANSFLKQALLSAKKFATLA